MIDSTLNLIVIKRELARKGTIQASFAESHPDILHHDLSASIVLANPSYPRIYFLQRKMWNASLNLPQTWCSQLYTMARNDVVDNGRKKWENGKKKIKRNVNKSILPCHNWYTPLRSHETESTRDLRSQSYQRIVDRSAIWKNKISMVDMIVKA